MHYGFGVIISSICIKLVADFKYIEIYFSTVPALGFPVIIVNGIRLFPFNGSREALFMKQSQCMTKFMRDNSFKFIFVPMTRISFDRVYQMRHVIWRLQSFFL